MTAGHVPNPDHVGIARAVGWRQGESRLDQLSAWMQYMTALARKQNRQAQQALADEDHVFHDTTGSRVHLAGRVSGSVAELAQPFDSDAEAERALRRFQRGGAR